MTEKMEDPESAAALTGSGKISSLRAIDSPENKAPDAAAQDQNGDAYPAGFATWTKAERDKYFADEAKRYRESKATAKGKPRLLVENCSPDRTVAALRDILSDSGGFYDRGVPVRLAFDQIKQGIIAQAATPDSIVLAAHRICRPYVSKAKAEENARLPRTFAVMYLDWFGEWRLPTFNGIAAAPLLQESGEICALDGYDATSGMWCEKVPDLTGLVPDQPTKEDAFAALLFIRETFKTFCYADAITTYDPYETPCFSRKEKSEIDKLKVVDIATAPGKDESAFLAGLLTAVCRPSLHLAPGLLFHAPAISGAGAGKGLLARCICLIAYGREPCAVTSGSTPEELEKRIAAELMGGSPALFLDNLNNVSFRSNLLASAITERPSSVRILGKSQMVQLNASSMVILTGNALTISEDLARRFIEVEFDAGIEDPEERVFPSDIRAEVARRRPELLAAVLTIWKWGRITPEIARGRTLGSFETWGRWVRDPLLALGCQDPVLRIGEAKKHDSRRVAIGELFSKWWETHEDRPVALNDLNDAVKLVADPQGRGRQYLAHKINSLVGTRLAGHVGVATYALKIPGGGPCHRGHRGHRPPNGEAQDPMTPMTPMPQRGPENSGYDDEVPPRPPAWETRNKGQDARDGRDANIPSLSADDDDLDGGDGMFAEEALTHSTDRQCPTCGEIKPITAFRKPSPHHLRGREECKECIAGREKTLRWASRFGSKV
jgi:hypothetical protein